MSIGQKIYLGFMFMLVMLTVYTVASEEFLDLISKG